MWNFNNISKKILIFVAVSCLFIGCSRRDDDHYNRLGVNYLNNGQHNYAVDAFKKAVNLNPSGVEAHFNLGRAYKRKSMDEQAKSEFSIAHRLNPNKFNEYVKKYKEKPLLLKYKIVKEEYRCTLTGTKFALVKIK